MARSGAAVWRDLDLVAGNAGKHLSRMALGNDRRGNCDERHRRECAGNLRFVQRRATTKIIGPTVDHRRPALGDGLVVAQPCFAQGGRPAAIPVVCSIARCLADPGAPGPWDTVWLTPEHA